MKIWRDLFDRLIGIKMNKSWCKLSKESKIKWEVQDGSHLLGNYAEHKKWWLNAQTLKGENQVYHLIVNTEIIFVNTWNNADP